MLTYYAWRSVRPRTESKEARRLCLRALLDAANGLLLHLLFHVWLSRIRSTSMVYLEEAHLHA